VKNVGKRVLAITIAAMVALAGVAIAPAPANADPHYAPYPDGVVITFNKWDTGVIGASSAFTAVWIAAAALGGQGGNRLFHSIWYIQAVAAYNGATGQCLWVWLPRNNARAINAGGYAC
jgi:hypothetical protein